MKDAPKVIELRLDYSKPENQEAFQRIKEAFPEVAEKHVASSQNEAWRENIFRYGKEHYAEYLLTRINHAEYLAIASEDAVVFEEVTFPAVLQEEPSLAGRAAKYLEGAEDEEIDDLITGAGVDVRGADLPLDFKAVAILELLVKQKSYRKAVEQQKEEGISYAGFEADSDFEGLNTFLESVFGRELLDQALISRIEYHPDTVLVAANPGRFNLPVEKYLQWKAKMPQLTMVKSRAESFSVINSSFNVKKYLRLPVDIYSFIDEKPEQLDYFKDVPADQRMRLYKLGAVAHEVGHSLYEYLTTKRARDEWKSIVAESNISHYSHDYIDGSRGNEVRLDEEFCEAIRLIATVPGYLRKNAPEAVVFMQKYFPSIRSAVVGR